MFEPLHVFVGTAGLGAVGWLLFRLWRWRRQRVANKVGERTTVAYGVVTHATLKRTTVNGGARGHQRAVWTIVLEQSPVHPAGHQLELSQWVTQADAFAVVVGARVELRWSARHTDPRITAASGPTGGMTPLFPPVGTAAAEIFFPMLLGGLLMLATLQGHVGEMVFGKLSSRGFGVGLTLSIALMVLPFFAGFLIPTLRAKRVPLERFLRLPTADARFAWVAWITDDVKGSATTYINPRGLGPRSMDATFALQPVGTHGAPFVVIKQRVSVWTVAIGCGGMAVELKPSAVPGQPAQVASLLIPHWRMAQMRQRQHRFGRFAKEYLHEDVLDPGGTMCRRYTGV